MRLRAASLDLKLAFDRVTPELLFDAMVDNATRSALAMALLCGRVGGRNMTSFQWITVYDVGFDRSIKQGGKESPILVRHGDAPLAETSRCGTEGATTRLQNTNVYKRRGRRSLDIACNIRGQLLHLGVDRKACCWKWRHV